MIPAKDVTNVVMELIKSQGFTVVLVLALAVWFAYDNYNYRNKLEKEYIKLQADVKNCNEQVLNFYQKDRKIMLEVITHNNQMLERIERRLDE